MNNWYTVTKNYSRCPYLNNVTLDLIHNIPTSKQIRSQTFFRQIYTLILYKGRFLFHFCLPVKKNSISISKAEVSLVHSHEVVISYDPVLVVIFSDISLKYKMLSYSNDIGFRPVHIKCRFYSYPQCPSFFILCFPK